MHISLTFVVRKCRKRNEKDLSVPRLGYFGPDFVRRAVSGERLIHDWESGR